MIILKTQKYHWLLLSLVALVALCDRAAEAGDTFYHGVRGPRIGSYADITNFRLFGRMENGRFITSLSSDYPDIIDGNKELRFPGVKIIRPGPYLLELDLHFVGASFEERRGERTDLERSLDGLKVNVDVRLNSKTILTTWKSLKRWDRKREAYYGVSHFALSEPIMFADRGMYRNADMGRQFELGPEFVQLAFEIDEPGILEIRLKGELIRRVVDNYFRGRYYPHPITGSYDERSRTDLSEVVMFYRPYHVPLLILRVGARRKILLEPCQEIGQRLRRLEAIADSSRELVSLIGDAMTVRRALGSYFRESLATVELAVQSLEKFRKDLKGEDVVVIDTLIDALRGLSILENKRESISFTVEEIEKNPQEFRQKVQVLHDEGKLSRLEKERLSAIATCFSGDLRSSHDLEETIEELSFGLGETETEIAQLRSELIDVYSYLNAMADPLSYWCGYFAFHGESADGRAIETLVHDDRASAGMLPESINLTRHDTSVLWVR